MVDVWGSNWAVGSSGEKILELQKLKNSKKWRKNSGDFNAISTHFLNSYLVILDMERLWLFANAYQISSYTWMEAAIVERKGKTTNPLMVEDRRGGGYQTKATTTDRIPQLKTITDAVFYCQHARIRLLSWFHAKSDGWGKTIQEREINV